MGVRGRSRTYTFADIFGSYTGPITNQIEANLTAEPIPGLSVPTSCCKPDPSGECHLGSAAGVNDVPTYTDSTAGL